MSSAFIKKMETFINGGEDAWLIGLGRAFGTPRIPGLQKQAADKSDLKKLEVIIAKDAFQLKDILQFTISS